MPLLYTLCPEAVIPQACEPQQILQGQYAVTSIRRV
jgi:hypothetical protein